VKLACPAYFAGFHANDKRRVIYNPNMDKKIQELQAKHEQLERELQNPDAFGNSQKMEKISKEYNDIGRKAWRR